MREHTSILSLLVRPILALMVVLQLHIQETEQEYTDIRVYVDCDEQVYGLSLEVNSETSSVNDDICAGYRFLCCSRLNKQVFRSRQALSSCM